MLYVEDILGKIGLDTNLIENFKNAGIVKPQQLADIDVSWYESLGVTDPDDKQKLLYLIELIKKKKTTPEGQGSPKRNFLNNDGGHNTDIPIHEEKKTEHLVAPSPEPRRSRRLASKNKDDTSGSAEGTDPILPSLARFKRQASSRRKTIAAATATTNPLMDAADVQATTKSPLRTDQQTTRERNINMYTPPRLSSQQSIASLDDFKHDSMSEGETTTNSEHEKEGVVGKDGHDHQNGTLSTVTKTNNNPKRTAKNGMMGRQQSKLPGSMRTGKNLASIPDSDLTPAPQSPIVALPSTLLQNENEETGVNNPSVKQNTAGARIRRPSARMALTGDADSLDELLASSMGSEASASSFDSSSIVSGGDSLSSDSNSQRRRQTSISSKRKGRAKSMYESDSSLKQYQHSQQLLQPPRSKRSSISKATPVVGRPSVGSGGRHESEGASVNSDQRKDPSQIVKTPTNSASVPLMTPIVQGMSESESWATKISYLREDNAEDHDLFFGRSEGEDDNLNYYYDMRIKVIVRKRPVSKRESLATGGVDIIHPLDYGDYGKILLYQPRTRVDLTKEVETVPFAFDNVFDESSTNVQIYERSLRHLIPAYFSGEFVTCFAYGQTGSGKTYTMMGSNITGINAGTATHDKLNLGLYYLAALDIFDMLKRDEYRGLGVQVSLFEIYGGKLFDLLDGAKKQIKCLEDSRGKVCFPGLTEHPVKSPEQVMELIERGAANRSTGETSRNADSSRSHAVLQIKLTKASGRRKIVEHGRFNFIDLAGSERGADTSNSSRATRLEGAEINTSLLALKEVIRALATGGSMTHIPFRGSKLTQVLKDSFVGENARCCMISCISPDIGNVDQTLNTLRYADRVKERNAESGALPSSCPEPTKVWASFQPLGLSSQEDSEDSSSFESQGGIPSSQHDNFIEPGYKDDSFVLTNPSPIKGPSTTEKQKAAKRLIEEHQAVMTKWLEMSHEEMELARYADGDNPNMVEYTARLEGILAQHSDWVSELRELLHQYVSVAEDPVAAPRQSAPIFSDNDDDSVEDLRD